MGGLKRHCNIWDRNLKNEHFCDYLQGRYWRTVCSLYCAKIIGSKKSGFYPQRWNGASINSNTFNCISGRQMEEEIQKKLCKTYFFFPKISLLHMDFLLHSLVTLETCLRSLHCNILCWTEQCSCQQMRVGPAPWGFQYLVSGCLSIKNHLYLHTLFLHILHIYPEEGFLKVQEAYGIFRLRNMEMGEKNFMPLSIKIFPCFLRAKKFEL